MKLDQREINLSLMNPRKKDTLPLESPGEDKSYSVFEQYFTEYWTSIYRLLARMVGDPSEAEDLALETFYRLYQHHPNPGSEFHVGGWLHRVAINLGLQSIRGFTRREHYELTAHNDILKAANDEGPLEMLDEKEESYKVRATLAKMNPHKSELLILRYTGKTYKEIAKALKLSPSSIGPLLLRAERDFERLYRTTEQEEQ